MQRSLLVTSSLVYLGIAGMAGAAFAGETAGQQPVFSLGEIVVADTTGVRDITIDNSVTAEEITQLGATTAAEALKYVPGMNVVQTTKGESVVNIQGFHQRDVLILIDGVPYYETQNGYLDLNQIPASIIGKIEITKGASSVLYGPNALGGVINIVTKKGVQGFAGNVSAEAGTNGYHRGAATINYGADNGFSVLATADYKSRDNLSFSDDYTPAQTNISYRGGMKPQPLSNPRVVDAGGDKENSDSESLNLWTRVGYAPTDDAEVYASVYHFEMERGRPFSDSHNKVFPNFSTFGRYDSYEDAGIDLGGRVAMNDWLSLRAMAFYHWHQDVFTSYTNEFLTTKLASSTWEDDSYGGALFTDMDLDTMGNVSVSLHYKEDKHKDKAESADPFENSHSSTFSLAVEDTITMDQFTGVVGVAWHSFDIKEVANIDDGYRETTLDPMVGLTWTGESGVRLFGSIAKKTRFPSFNDMENDNKIFSLKPQKNVNFTLGTEYSFCETTDVVVSAFYNDVKDLFGENDNGDPINIGKAEIYGIELSSKTSLGDRWSLGLDYTLTHARNTSADRESDFLEDIPEHIIGASVGYRIPVLEADAQLRALWRMDNYIVADKYDEITEDSVVLDFSIRKKLDNNITLAGYVNNILDENFYEGDGMANNGISCKVVLQYDFQ